MARRRKERPAKKFGTPLYCAVWPTGNYAFVGGGGGKSSSGIANKIVTIHCENGKISGAEAGSVRLSDAPMRMALPLQETTMAVALGDGGILKFSIARDAEGVPTLQPVEGNAAEEFERADAGDAWPSPAVAGYLADTLDLWPSHTVTGVWGEGGAYVSAGKAAEELAKVGIVECMAFSSDGRFLGVSTADGALTIYDWHMGRPLNVLRAEHGVDSTIRDLDFSPAHQDKVLAAVADNGTCSLWAWQTRMRIGSLDLPKELQKGAFAKVRWMRDSLPTLYAVVNLDMKGEGHILKYEQTEEGEIELRRQALLQKKKITAFALSKSGSKLGIGSVEGDAAVFDAATLRPLRQSADAHMVFVTAVGFDSQESCLLSASADASAWLTSTQPQGGVRVSTIAILLILLLLLLLGCTLAASFIGFDARILALLSQLGVRQGSHTEL